MRQLRAKKRPHELAEVIDLPVALSIVLVSASDVVLL